MNKKWTDQDFKADETSLFWKDQPYLSRNLEQYGGDIVWKRVTEIQDDSIEEKPHEFWLEGYKGSKAPSLFGDNKLETDFIQGEVLDSEFLGAVAAIHFKYPKYF